MSAQPTFGFSISSAESLDFARLSGDFNPLHIDPIRARRLQFGGTVCHGVHLVLKALDLLAAQGLVQPAQLQSISALFAASVRNGLRVELVLASVPAAATLRLSASAGGRPLFSAKLGLGCDQPGGEGPQETNADSAAEPDCAAFPQPGSLQDTASSVPLQLHRPLFAALFPALARLPQAAPVVADLLATTRIVGMRLPGLHSIFSELKLQRSPADGGPARNAMAYVATKADARFRSLRIGVQGGVMQGTLEAFFRAPPVDQPAISAVMQHVSNGRYARQHALVVGGSRGLGELAAKILLAGGARVTLSYARGHADAQRIGDEARRAGLDCEHLQIDASQPLPTATAQALANAGFTHLCYFATPQIVKSPAGSWNAALFDDYCRVYVHGFTEIVKAAAATAGRTQPLHVLCPSTAFLDHAEPGFAEYCAAKAAAETLCDQLAQGPHVHVSRPRLPRMQTDQTGSFLGSDAADPLPVMLATLQAFCSPSDTNP